MNIAVIGWGSLIWCPGSLVMRTMWRKGGPLLPLEFARISADGRLTLVIHPGSALQETYWALSGLTELAAARRNLAEREGCSVSKIRSFPGANADKKALGTIVAELETWLARREGVDAVIWTGLTTNWEKRFRRPFSPEDAVRYLEELDARREKAKVTYDRAREYVQNAPPSIQTAVRVLMREKGWADAKLSDGLFDTEEQE